MHFFCVHHFVVCSSMSLIVFNLRSRMRVCDNITFHLKCVPTVVFFLILEKTFRNCSIIRDKGARVRFSWLRPKNTILAKVLKNAQKNRSSKVDFRVQSCLLSLSLLSAKLFGRKLLYVLLNSIAMLGKRFFFCNTQKEVYLFVARLFKTNQKQQMKKKRRKLFLTRTDIECTPFLCGINFINS